jgi:hypothetical protein
MTYLLLLLLLPLTSFASLFDLSEEELNPEAEEILLKKPEKYQRHESMIYDFDSDLGIKDQRQYTGSDRNRISLAGHISGNYEQVGDILGGEINYMRRSTRYNQIWWGAQFFQHKTYFDAITQNRRNPSSNANAESNYQRPGDVKNTVMAAGLGVGYRFKLLLDFFETEDTFEAVDVFVNGLQLDETYIKKKYRGYGLTTNYGIHKRSSTSFFYGGKFSYNIASVTREAIGNEKKSDRSLSLGWLSVAFELGFFF